MGGDVTFIKSISPASRKLIADPIMGLTSFTEPVFTVIMVPCQVASSVTVDCAQKLLDKSNSLFNDLINVYISTGQNVPTSLRAVSAVTMVA